MKRALVCGAGGFVGSHMVRRLKHEGFSVVGVDLKKPEFHESEADEFLLGDLRDQSFCRDLFARVSFDELYQFAADMGGAGFIFTGDNDAAIMHNSASINLNVLHFGRERCGRLFYSSSACIYPAYNQEEASSPDTREFTAYPAQPDSEYGWEKLFSERLYIAHARNFGLSVRIGRYHNIFGPFGTWTGGREKAPAAICRKVAETPHHGTMEIWGDGEQTRSFLYIDECIEGTLRLMRSDFADPVNIGSEEMVTINQLAALAMDIAGKQLSIRHVPGPLGVRGRTSNNDLIRERLNWAPSLPLRTGIERTYRWIEAQVRASANIGAVA